MIEETVRQKMEREEEEKKYMEDSKMKQKFRR